MRIQRQWLLAIVIAAMSLGALPSIASGAAWTDKGKAVTAEFSIGLTGGEVYEYAGGTSSMACSIKGTMLGGPSGLVKITGWEETECGPGFGGLSGCKVATYEAKGLPWIGSISSGPLIVVSKMRIRHTYKAGCPITETDATTNTTFSPDNLNAISEFSTNGQASGGFLSFGSYTINAPKSGTTGIG
jgi:hypothetical protein